MSVAVGCRSPRPWAGRSLAGDRARSSRWTPRPARVATSSSRSTAGARRWRREAPVMAVFVWVVVALALWHFAVLVPDRFWGGGGGSPPAAVLGGGGSGVLFAQPGGPPPNPPRAGGEG